MIIKAFFFSVLSVFSQEPKKIVFVGDSLTEGYGVSKEQSYPHLLQQKIDKSHPGKFQILNSSISGSTTASLVSRTDWVLKSQPYAVVIALGANDGLRGQGVDLIDQNISNAIKVFQKNKIKVLLLGMRMPPNYGIDYTVQFDKVFKKIADKNKTPLMPFLLDKVAGDKGLNQSDGIHPNEKGHQIMSETVYKFLVKNLL
jgi:acyl-CoA thioesterase-1